MSQQHSALFHLKVCASMAWHITRMTGRMDQALRFAGSALWNSDGVTGLTWKGIRLNARAKDWNGMREVLVEQEYGPVAEHVRGRARPVVLDMGANIGTFSAFVFSIAPDAVVHAYEPSQDSHKVLTSSLADNPALAWTAHRGAIFGSDGQTTFSNAAASTGSRIATGGDERVPTFSLATAVANAGGHVTLAKMDIEGAEEAALVAGETELQKIDTLVVEIHPALCDEAKIRSLLAKTYAEVRDLGGRQSSKPLLVATNRRA
jgi:FkbM family methyltransferase